MPAKVFWPPLSNPASTGCSDHLAPRWGHGWRSVRALESDRPVQLSDAQHLYDIAQQNKSVVGPSRLIKKSSLWVTLQIISGTRAVSNILQRETWLERSRMFQDVPGQKTSLDHFGSNFPQFQRPIPTFIDSFMSSRWVPSSCNLRWMCADWVTRLRNGQETHSSIW